MAYFQLHLFILNLQSSFRVIILSSVLYFTVNDIISSSPQAIHEVFFRMAISLILRFSKLDDVVDCGRECLNV